MSTQPPNDGFWSDLLQSIFVGFLLFYLAAACVAAYTGVI